MRQQKPQNSRKKLQLELSKEQYAGPQWWLNACNNNKDSPSGEGHLSWGGTERHDAWAKRPTTTEWKKKRLRKSVRSKVAILARLSRRRHLRRISVTWRLEKKTEDKGFTKTRQNNEGGAAIISRTPIHCNNKRGYSWTKRFKKASTAHSKNCLYCWSSKIHHKQPVEQKNKLNIIPSYSYGIKKVKIFWADENTKNLSDKRC